MSWPVLIRKFHEAKLTGAPTVTLWGSGEPFREFLYVDDLAVACVFLINRCDYGEIAEFINIGTGRDIQIKTVANLVMKIFGFEGTLEYDRSTPDGTPKAQA